MRYIYAILLLVSFNCWASPAEEPETNSIPILETAQRLLGGRVNGVANQLDSFFATERADDELGRSRIRIRSNFSIRERAKSQLNNTYRINLKLPHLNDRVKFDYYSNKEKKKNKKKQAEEPGALRPAPSTELDTRWLFNADTGVNASIPPRITTRARIRKSFKTGTLVHRFVEQLTFVTDESGLVNETSLNTDQVYSDKVLFRFVNNARWRISKKNFVTAHGPTLLHQITDDDAFAYSALLSTTIFSSTPYVASYTLAFNWRRNVYKNWIYMDIIPGIDFPKEWSFRRTPFIFAQVEILFGS